MQERFLAIFFIRNNEKTKEKESGHCATRVSSAAAQVSGCHFFREVVLAAVTVCPPYLKSLRASSCLRGEIKKPVTDVPGCYCGSHGVAIANSYPQSWERQ